MSRTITVRELRAELAAIGLDLDDAYVLDASLGWMQRDGVVTYSPTGKIRGTRKMKALAAGALTNQGSEP